MGQAGAPMGCRRIVPRVGAAWFCLLAAILAAAAPARAQTQQEFDRARLLQQQAHTAMVQAASSSSGASDGSSGATSRSSAIGAMEGRLTRPPPGFVLSGSSSGGSAAGQGANTATDGTDTPSTSGQAPAQPAAVHVTLTANPSQLHVGDTVRFLATLDRQLSVVHYFFSFGDGTPVQAAAGNSVEHVYTSPGSFNAAVYVRYDGPPAVGGPIALRVESPPPQNPALHVDLAASLSQVQAGGEVRFYAKPDQALPGVRYGFVFGDGTETKLAFDTSVVHAYDKPGTYTASLQVRYDGPVQVGAPVQIQVEPPQPQPVPVPRPIPQPALHLTLVATPAGQVVVGRNVAFHASPDRPVPGARYSFDFGDGNSSEFGPDDYVEHAYTVPGNYTVGVQLRHGARVTYAAPVQVQVVRAPVWWRSTGLAAGALVAALIAASLLWRLLRRRQPMARASALSYAVRKDAGRASVRAQRSSVVGTSVQLRAVRSAPTVRIEFRRNRDV